MKVVILAGGYGTRISEESALKPKPMVEIGESPILWHIMKYYSHFGFNDFIICCGYKSYVIKEYFADYYLHKSDITFDFSENNKMIIHNNVAEPWRVTLVDTGIKAQTGARIKRIQKYVDDEDFMLTYGDGVCDVDLKKLIEFHKKTQKIATITAVQPKARFGILDIEENRVLKFEEKPKQESGWINGGFMVLKRNIFNYLNDDEELIFEREPLNALVADEQLSAFKHYGFWQCMDTLRDKHYLEKLWSERQAPWTVWEGKQ